MNLAVAREKPQPVSSAAVGIRVHSGWGALVAVSGKAGAEQILDRRRIDIIDARMAGAAQPYHFAAQLDIREAETHIAKCAAMAARLALEGLRELSNTLRERGCHVTGAAILLSSARPLPALEKILASHPMIHTAEGEFFRQAFREACQTMKIAVTGIRERDLEERATAAFGKAASQAKKRIDREGRGLGAPWTVDQKAAALAAAIVLAEAPAAHQ